MNWEEVEENVDRNGHKVQDILTHWQKLGKFRNAHLSVGAGVHSMISKKPYIFKRTYQSDNINDAVIVGLNLSEGEKEIPVDGIFKDGETIKDYYSGQTVTVKNQQINLTSDFNIVLLGT
jgi:alpha-amylase